RPWTFQQEDDVNELIRIPMSCVARTARRAVQRGSTRLRVKSRMLGIAALVVCATSGGWGNAFAAAPAAPASGAAPGLAPESQGFRQATERERDAETLQSLTSEGRLLLSRD